MKRISTRKIWILLLLGLLVFAIVVVCAVGVETRQRIEKREAIADSLASTNITIRETCALNQLLKDRLTYYDQIISIIDQSENPELLYAGAKWLEYHWHLNSHPREKQSSTEAFKMAYYYLLAAEQGHPTAQAEFSRCLMNGFGVSSNKKLAFEWASKSAVQGDSVGIYALGMCKAKGYGTYYDPDSAIILLRQAAATGYERAQQMLMIELPKVPEIDYDAY